jgi:hypothetical protein
VTLAQFAAVLAAEAEGHDIARVLAHEGIEPASWPQAEQDWSDRIAGAGAELRDAFVESLTAAQERYGRRLPPIDQELRAFLDFRRRWSLDPDPPALLARIGLRLDEIARLTRFWSARVAADPALFAQEQAILREEPGELPAVTPVVVEIPPPAPVSKAVKIERGDEDDDKAELDEAPLFAPLPGWEAVATSTPEPSTGKEAPAPAHLAGDERAAVGGKPSFLQTAALVLPASTPPLPAANLAATSAFVAPARAPIVPFTMHDARAGAPEPPAPGSPTAAPPLRPPLTGTATLDEGIRFGAATPFEAPHAPSGLAMTAPVTLPVDGPVLPFVGAPMGARPLPELSIARFAAFCAELEVFPETADETFRRYGVGSVRAWRDLDAKWRARLVENPAEQKTWEQLHQSYLEHCRTSGRPEVPA